MTNEDLAEAIRAGRAGYGELWDQVQAFVRQQAARYLHQNAGLCAGAGIDFDDLFQAGFLALYDAVGGYDQAAGMAFVGYLAYYLKRHFRAVCGIRSTKRDPLLTAVRLDKPVSEEEGAATLGELTPDPQGETEREEIEEALYSRQLRGALERALDTLDEKQRDIVRRRYGLTGPERGETLDSIAAEWGVTREQVRQTERKALRALRRPQSLRLLRSFHEEIISRYAWRGTGLTAYRENGASSVERAAEKTDDLMKRIKEQKERDKAEWCALLSIAPEEYVLRYGRE